VLSGDMPEPVVRRGWSGRVRGLRSLGRLWSRFLTVVTVAAVVVGGVVAIQAAMAADGGLGPDPTAAMVGSGQGPFGEETVDVPAGNGFGGGTIHVPRDAGGGPFGVVVICPALSAGKGYYEWMGSKAASFGLVTFVIDTNDPGDLFDERRDQILKAADWLTTSSPVKGKVDPARVGVVGHSAGGGGAINAAQQRSSLKAAVGMAPVGANAGGLRVPTMLVGGTNDGWSSPETLKGLYGGLAGPKSLVEITDGGHGFPAGGSMEMFRAVLPWLKVFVDNDSRYAQFLCPGLSDTSGISDYQATCPLTPSGDEGGGSSGPSTSAPASQAPEPGVPASPPASTPTGGTPTGGTPTGGTPTGGTPTGAIGPSPTAEMVSSGKGPYTEATVDVPAGNGFGGGTIHYPKDAQGPLGAVVLCPAFAAGKGYYEWIGGKASTFGLVVFVIDTNSPNDYPDARKDQMLAAADWLAKSSSIKDKVDPDRLGVVGHSAGGGGALNAAQARPSIKAAVGLAPGGGNANGLKVPTMLIGGTGDGLVNPDAVRGAYGSLAGPKAMVEIKDAGHGFPAGGSMEMFRAMLPWLKLFVDNDTRYAQFLCPDLADKDGIADYQATCPLTPAEAPATSRPDPSTPTPSTTAAPAPGTTTAEPAPGTTTAEPAPSRLTSDPSNRPPAQGSGSCQVAYRTVAQWQGGFLADLVVTNGDAPVDTWSLSFSFGSEDQKLVHGWNGRFTQAGTALTVGNMTWNGSLPARGTARVGLVALQQGDNSEPTGFALNGTACNASTADPAAPPATPGSSAPPAAPAEDPTTGVPGTATPDPTSTRAEGPKLPCDTYAAGGTPCVAAYGTVRALSASYGGPLYQVQRDSDHQLLDIKPAEAGGYADAAPQEPFCAGTKCVITKLYDQTTNHNDLPISWGGYWKGPGPNGSDVGADAMALPVSVAGHKAYGVMVTSGVGYRVDKTKGVAVGAEPEGMYMVTSSDKTSPWCCFDFGNAQTTHTADGPAIMDAIYWGTACWFKDCVGEGPWVQADLEFGMFHNADGSNKDPKNPGVTYPFVSAWLKNDGVTNFTLKYGNANEGPLTVPYSGPLPKGYSPMKKQGSVLLGTGGDNSQLGVGEFFEGAMTSGYPSDVTENAVQANITSAGFGKS
jgi:dienelactone hydrolase